jgi:hypothetical protein
LILQAPAALSAATTFTWSSTDPANGNIALSGSVTFTTQTDATSGFDLVITLTNTGPNTVVSSADLLTGLYFDINGGGGLGALGMLSATTSNLGLFNTLGGTNTGTAANICAPGVGGTAQANKCSATLGGGWEAGFWSAGVSSKNANLPTVTAHYGIGTSGQTGLFNGNANNGVGGSNYSIAPGSTPNGNGSVNTPLVDQSATFVLYGLNTSSITISNVFAAYGTAPEVVAAATNITSLPEPGTLSELAGGGLLIAIGGFFRKRRSSV